MSGLPASPAEWTVRVVDLDGVTDKAEFMARWAAALDLPDWFGRNWDALADTLGDPEQLPDAAGWLVLVVTGWERFRRLKPEQWETALDVFGRASAASVLLSLG
ncbi:barstar family protein [Streptomyces sp. NPDC102467]|uniref:barstar family protein n=1 Tax=Streptomyces sp. NPDC102467 TaxID=3366179 RepID=UPI0037F1A413